jgi:putative peptide zinc metalloprotease protein
MTAAGPLLPDFPKLPALREDLQLVSSANNPDGSPTWVMQDSVRNKFIQIGWLEFELLSRWQPDVMPLLQDLVNDTRLTPSVDDVYRFAEFLKAQGLTQWIAPKDLLVARSMPKKPGLENWRWWLHNYLFFRIPLVRPDAWLQRLLPYLRWLFSPITVVLIIVTGVLGLSLVARNWDVFTQTFVDSLTFEGFLSFAVALMLAKLLHEMGHAIVATHYGVRVAHMGVAFLVMWPMLYTDTGESWRLKNHWQRLHIAIAGIAVEATLAGLSMAGWALSPPGALKSAFFYLATTSLIMTIALNMSPFMRFDGYYVVSDALNMPNLHERSGALARTWIRRSFLGWRDAWPEHFPRNIHSALVSFAVGTWVYRFFLFLGIAVAVYVMFFKALGIFLFAVEIIWFIAKPVYSEMKVWHRRRVDIQAGRASLWLLVLLAPIVLLAFPWSHRLHAPAHLQAEHQTVYSPLAGTIVLLKAAGAVKAGEQLVVLDSPKLRNDAERARINAQSTKTALQSAQVTSTADQVGKLDQNFEQFKAEGKAASQELARLNLAASFNGRWTDTDVTLQKGTWVRPQDQLGTLVNENKWFVEAWVEEAQLEHLKVGAQGKFYASNRIDSAIKIRLIEADTVRAASLPHPGLSTEHGGLIPTTTENKVLVPRSALYRVRFEVVEPTPQQRWTSGHISVEGESYSMVWRSLRYAMSVLIRESGF